jgi:hypothetical protein
MRRWICLFLIVAVAAAIAVRYRVSVAREERDPWDIREAVLRAQIGQRTETCYVKIEKMDPPASFLARFAGQEPPVRPGSQFRQGTGVLYWIDEIKRTGSDSAEVSGGYHIGSLGGALITYHVVRKEGRWVVESQKIDAVALQARQRIFRAA